MGGSPTAVLKLGGEVVADTPLLMSILREAAGLVRRGWRIAVCHGGGPQANALQSRLGLPVVKVGGRRVTDAATLQVVKQVLAGEVAVDVVAAAALAGLRAVAVSGVSADLVTAHRRPPRVVSGGGPDPIDFGFVGDVTAIDPSLVLHLWQGGYTPVVATLAIADPAERAADPSRPAQVYNVNADTVASALAAALAVDHLFLWTDVPGVLRDKDDPATRIPRLDAASARRAIADGTIVGGMIPKVEEALENLGRGIRTVHILGARSGSLAGEAEQPGSCGTVLEAQ
jgi:acetylglutamate kinase